MTNPEIGKTAGEVWKCLSENGKIPLAELPNKVKAKAELVHQAIGWLAREDKVEVTNHGKAHYVSLSSNELNNYRQQKGDACKV